MGNNRRGDKGRDRRKEGWQIEKIGKSEKTKIKKGNESGKERRKLQTERRERHGD